MFHVQKIYIFIILKSALCFNVTPHRRNNASLLLAFELGYIRPFGNNMFLSLPVCREEIKMLLTTRGRTKLVLSVAGSWK